jgi:hypothetical protein
MKQIQPVQIWVNGSIKEAIYLYLQINFDNLLDTAVFYYSLNDSEKSKITEGNIAMSKETYLGWNGSNSYAWDFAATELNLVFAPNTTEVEPVIL